MSRSSSLSVLAFGTFLLLTACSGGDEPATDAESAPASASAEASAEASTESGSTPSAEAEAGTGTYTDEELAALLTSITAPDGSALTVVPASQLDPLMDQGMQALDGVAVTPAECDVFNETSLAPPEGATYAVGVALSADGAPETTVTVVSVEGAEDLMRTQAEESTELLETCSSYEMEVEGVTLTAQTELIDTTTEGNESQGARSTITLPTGETLRTTTISAASGDFTVTAMNQQAGAEGASVDGELEQLVNDVLAAADQG
ncbi:hypothetical protein AC792_06495 [Arthrobacter sp. RIT-PI-e]|uniref:hypothetical protein n=1 Tax=Arthrobacter sp. RIT-PI-e TaxID=1681197 RepID=UPI0006767DD6|nr:hypothetical protein [Arthrobacter sp. RIT-PI-e]KNC19486.1 hypothetical protein AC792_06495 [Arthrobacter sp. RIT-PI-e]